MVIGIDASRANVAERTGTERYAFEVISRLVMMWPQHQLRLYVREPLRNDWPTLPKNVAVCVLTWAPGVLWSHLRLSWELLWHRPDILFVPADTVPLIHPRRCATTIHDVAFERWPELYRTASVQRRLGWLRPIVHGLVRVCTLGRYSASERDYHRWSVRQAVRSSPLILTVSHFSKQEIVATLHVNPERIRVTPLGIRQPDRFKALSADNIDQVKQRFNLQRPYALFVGRLESKKNIDLTIKAVLAYNQQSTQPLDVVLIGQPGYGWSETANWLQQTPLRYHVHQLGWQPDAVRDALYRGARIFLCLSQYEGFGIPAAEALSAGVPVLASRHGSLPEVLGPAALYVDTENFSDVVTGLQRLMQDEERRSELIGQGNVQIQQFTWERTAHDTQQALEMLLARKP